MKSQQRGLCGRCEENYQPYMLLVKKCFPAYVELVSLWEKYGWLCPGCLNELMHSRAYAVLPT